ncbi:hypothetical protein [Streptomyces sp. S.PNR 29]|uniref:hypothetical protein n=1 Tax=Streptomyces sp. S.PNR 29 TaxID=2973805 RepID=UPI0025B025CC|nr:hypothetical protein [Streptomyces sp. S.PNR 29]MDN0199244.1 hypothetical protein [Streptomyces sp. S.PNR 29]
MAPDEIAKTTFACWLLNEARVAGYDTDHDETRASILVIAAVALSNGLDTKATASVAEMLGVTRAEVTAAYVCEMRQTVLAALLDHPDLAEADARLDEIARTG